MDGRERQASGQAAGGGAGIHPGQLEGHQRQRQVLGALDEAAVLGVHEDGGDAGIRRRPGAAPAFRAVHSCVLRAPSATSRATGPRATRARRLHQHLQIVAVGEAPQDLADVVAGQGAQVVGGVFGSGKCHGCAPFVACAKFQGVPRFSMEQREVAIGLPEG